MAREDHVLTSHPLAPDSHEARFLTLDVSLCPAQSVAPEGRVAGPMIPLFAPQPQQTLVW